MLRNTSKNYRGSKNMRIFLNHSSEAKEHFLQPKTMSAVKLWRKVTWESRLICALLTEFQSVTCSAQLAGARRDPKGGQSGHSYCEAPHSLLAVLSFSAPITRWRRICDCLAHPFFTHLPVSSIGRNHVHTAYRCDSSPRGCTHTHTRYLSVRHWAY